MMLYTDDPVADYDRWNAAQEDKVLRLPECAICGEHIQQEDAVYINDEFICDECLEESRVSIFFED